MSAYVDLENALAEAYALAERTWPDDAGDLQISLVPGNKPGRWWCSVHKSTGYLLEGRTHDGMLDAVYGLIGEIEDAARDAAE